MFSRARLPRAAAIAVGLGLGTIGVVAMPTVALTGVGVGLLAGSVVNMLAPKTDPLGLVSTRGTARRAGLAVGAITLWGWLAVTGLVALLGPVSGPVILTLLLAAVVLSRLRARRLESPSTGTRPAVTCQELSTPELCLAWRHSDLALLELPNGSARCPVVRVRERLLDELERRDPDGFTHWLETDAQTGGDPGRHLTTER
jgi:hypothetical protein